MNSFARLFKRRQLYEDLSEEIREYLEEKTSELINDGMSAEEAALAARREFGNVTVIEERGRETWHWLSLEALLADVGHAVRSLRKSPGFTSVVLLTLALGIGANSAIFSLVNAVLLRSLPFAEPDRLLTLSQDNYYPQGGFVAMKSNLKTMDVAAYLEGWGDARVDFNLTGEGEPERLYGSAVSAEFFSLLGVTPERGRVFASGEDQPGKNMEVVLSHALWEHKFKGDPNAIGRRIMLAGASYEIVGVMPAQFQFPSSKTEVWVPLSLDPRATTYWDGPWVPVIGRLRSGVSIESARAELDVFQQRLLPMMPFKLPSNTWKTDSVFPLRQQIVGDLRSKLLIILGATALVLLIACANVANLLLARATTRQREMAVRASLGAGRWRICRQLLTESVLLGIAGSVAGLALAYIGIAGLKAMLTAEDIPRLASVSIDLRVLLFTATIGVLTGVMFGLAPALHLSKLDLSQSLKTRSKNVAASGHRLRTSLAVSEIALAVVLVIGAGLLIRSLWQLLHVNPGFSAESVVTARVTPDQSFCDDFSRCQSFYSTLVDRMRASPGVHGAALVNALPLNGRVGFIAANFEGHPENNGQEVEPLVFDSVITPGYLSVMQISLLEGRGFSDSDARAQAEPVALITASTARKYWPGQDPIGMHVKPAWENQWRRIVGVVGDVREDSLSSTLPSWISGAIYEPHSAHAVLINRRPATEMTLVLRGTTDAKSLGEALRETVADLNPEVPVTEVQTLRGVINKSLSVPRSIMSLFAVFAALAVGLGAVGVYGVISYSVAMRTPEIGVRIALGAQRRDVQRLVLGQGARIAAIGVALGVAGALVTTRLMTAMLYGVTATDPATFGAVTILLTFIAVAACYIPARRAARLDPLVALRYE